MNKDKLFLATINGELVGVMTMANAIKLFTFASLAFLSANSGSEKQERTMERSILTKSFSVIAARDTPLGLT